MGLVGYSDSEGSASESEAPKKVATKPAFQKVVSRTEPNKVRISLKSSEDSLPSEDLSDRPTKRARTGGGLGGFSAMLPAPKNAAKAKGDAGECGTSRFNLGKGRSMGSGISLKTGAAPAFSRDIYKQDNDLSLHARTSPPEAESNAEKEPVATTAPSTSRKMFRPLSVSRKPQKKSVVASVDPTLPDPTSDSKAQSHTVSSPKKIALFSTHSADEDIPASHQNSYQPLLHQVPVDDDQIIPETEEATVAAPQATDRKLENIAESLNLTASQRRQLFGRSGTASDAQVAEFNLAAEYAHNRAVAEQQGDTLAHNPVRSVAPGRHSLQQLMNNATSQYEALEESFASGRRNKAEAGKKYGW